MSLIISNYSNYLTYHYNDFLTHLETNLGPGKPLKFHKVEVFYLVKVGATWDKSNRHMHRSTLDYLPPSMSDLELYNYISKGMEAAKDEKNKPADYEKLVNLLKFPVESEPVQAYFKTIRENDAKVPANPCQKLREVFKETFDNLFQDPSKEYMVLSKKVVIEYFLTEEASDFSTVTFEKNYAQKCAKCPKWRTTAQTLSKCSICVKTYYCSRECQKADWKSHKVTCQTT